MLTDTQAREAFHFTLLRRLVGQVPESLRLKGGVNLRLFFGSVRYSEDMDLDADLRLQPRLVDQLQRIIVAPDYRKELLQLGIEDVSTAPSPAVLQFLRDWHPLGNLETARDRCLEIREDQFQEQVGAYLEPTIRGQYETRWDEIRLLVHGHLDTAITLSVTPEPAAPTQMTPAPAKPRRSR